jgi:hypothetical protein
VGRGGRKDEDVEVEKCPLRVNGSNICVTSKRFSEREGLGQELKINYL